MTENSTSGGAAPTHAQTPPARPPPPLCPLLQDGEDYDAWVLAGGRLFRAHGSVLASHSAYLRAAVGGEREARLLLPHVPPAGFAAILAYMYTGRLPLTPATLYEVLVAGHLLQMPGVVSLCQALLSGTSATPSTAAMLGTIPDVPPALSVWRGLARFVPPQHVASTSSTSSSTTIVRPTPTRPRPHHPLKHAHVVPPELTREVESSEGLAGNLEDTCSTEHQEGIGPMENKEKYFRRNTTIGETLRSPSGTVIIDIAACDGPVFFERVINRAYKANPLLGHDDSETETEINVEELDSEPGSEILGSESHKPGRDISGAENSNSSETSSLTNSNRLETGGVLQNPRTISPPIPHNQSSRTYHCVYCNHTFKSHYCYQKHMRRHINPITVEVDKLRGASLPSPGKTESLQEGGGRAIGAKETRTASTGRAGSMSPYSSSGTVSPAPSERLKILDLNVQYFPCKTCGSKFPSYYFVHKHRRLCHQEEENASLNEKRAKTPSSKPARTPTPTGGATTPKTSTAT